MVIAAILFILASLLLCIAIARLSNKDSMKSALNIKEVFSYLSKIKWLNHTVYSIVFVLILAIILIISLVISIIPFIDIILLFLVIIPFIIMFFGRTLGLIYKKSKKYDDNL